ncbi:MAG TPA: tRNA epoxyqueuosine(34) reductase QueG [Flavobacteriales bacterium]|nr:tRNA epoxyqueuosine(34) reductase QueG [Flavobacteriales bacterium]HRP80391.1 tRNA epoxyqueuosine(34) reductase QueG [Flavobacteriales bacterium]HRQ83574.1 tRNA epoxyqueuosine(34) reductase QueG [Flavobacteriales bacterium]
MGDPKERSERIKAKAMELGFLACGIATADFLAGDASRLEQWLHAGKHGQMDWLARNFDLRTDPRQLVPGAKSVISLAYNYYAPSKQTDPAAPKISTYAYGRDYHKVVKQRMKPLMQFITETYGQVEMRCFTDSAPVLEKAWAERAGIGWRGKHSLIIRKGQGSYFFLAEIILDLELAPDAPATDHCGTCRRCIDACPTEAIELYGINASKCISYYTIELKGAIPDDSGNFRNWAFGCDICQQVCPWNKFSTPHTEPDFNPRPELMELPAAEWDELTEERFEKLFFGSPVKRTKYAGLMRNVRYLKRN